MLMVNHLAGFAANAGQPGWIFSGGSADASSTFSPASNAFDFDNGTAWISDSTTNEWVRYALAAPRVGNLVRLRNHFNAGSASYRTKDFLVQGSVDNSSWTTLVSNTLPADADDHDYTFTDAQYQYWRLFCTNSYGGANCGITEFQVYGLLKSPPSPPSRKAGYFIKGASKMTKVWEYAKDAVNVYVDFIEDWPGAVAIFWPVSVGIVIWALW